MAFAHVTLFLQRYRKAPWMVLLCLLLCWIRLHTVWRNQGNHPHCFSACIPPTTKSGGIRNCLYSDHWDKAAQMSVCVPVTCCTVATPVLSIVATNLPWYSIVE